MRLWKSISTTIPFGISVWIVLAVLSSEKGKKLKSIYEKDNDLAVFVEKANRLDQGFSLQYDGEFVYLVYPQCYCSCVKRIDAALPETWCYCTLGYTKKMFEYIFDKGVEVELISSIKQGDPICKIKIKPSGNVL